MTIMLRIRYLVYFAWVRDQDDLPPSVRGNLRRGEQVIAEADSEIQGADDKSGIN